MVVRKNCQFIILYFLILISILFLTACDDFMKPLVPFIDRNTGKVIGLPPLLGGGGGLPYCYNNGCHPDVLVIPPGKTIEITIPLRNIHNYEGVKALFVSTGTDSYKDAVIEVIEDSEIRLTIYNPVHGDEYDIKIDIFTDRPMSVYNEKSDEFPKIKVLNIDTSLAQLAVADGNIPGGFNPLFKSHDLYIVKTIDTVDVTASVPSGLGSKISINNDYIPSGVSTPVSVSHLTDTQLSVTVEAECGYREPYVFYIRWLDLLYDEIAFSGGDIESIYGDTVSGRTITNSGAGAGVITYSSSDTTVATVNANTGTVTILKAGTTTITATKESDDVYMTATASYTITVSPKPLTITGLGAANKVYDGTAAATITGTAVLSGIAGADDVALVTVSAAASFDNKNVGTGKTVTFSGYSLSGSASGNYSLTQPASVTADITALTVTITGISITKVYDGNANVTNWGTLSFDGLVVGETAAVSAPAATYNDANVGANKAITITGAGTFTMTGGTAAASNYSITQPTSLTGEITRASANFVSVTQNGSATKTTDTLTLTFDKEIIGLTAADISLSGMAVTKGTLGHTAGTVVYTLGITGLTAGGTLTVMPNYSNYTFSPLERTVTVYAVGEGGLNIEYWYDEDSRIGGTYTTPVTKGDIFEFTLVAGYTVLSWHLNGTELSDGVNGVAIAANKLTIDTTDYNVGAYNLDVIVYREGIPFSKRITFSVED